MNKVSTAVTLRHRPSGLSVTVQDSRSQATNRKLARERLIAALEQERRKAAAAVRDARERERRRRAPRPARLKKKILEAKRQRGALKKGRASVRREID